ncbi:hypothetical protein LOTGIDRAFT_158032, partial [Lottia gigantea]
MSGSEPSKSHHCVVINKDFEWKVKNCDEDHDGLCRCRKRRTGGTVEYECSGTGSKTFCIEEKSGEYCYWLEDENKEKAHKLQQACRKRTNGQLATISDEHINQNVTSHFKSRINKDTFVWIGVTNRLWYTNDGGVIRNEDIIWDDDNISPDKHCAVVKVGSGFRVDKCKDDKHAFYGICESTDRTSYPTICNLIILNCKGSKTTTTCSDSNCYWKTNGKHKKKIDAEWECRNGGGKLFIPKLRYDTNNNVIIVDTVSNSPDDTKYWTGMTDKVRVWYNRRDSDIQHWFKWNEGEPDDGSCVIIKPEDDFQWSTTKCQGNKNYPALCMKFSNSKESGKSTIPGSSDRTNTQSCKETTQAQTDAATQTSESTKEH